MILHDMKENDASTESSHTAQQHFLIIPPMERFFGFAEKNGNQSEDVEVLMSW